MGAWYLPFQSRNLDKKCGQGNSGQPKIRPDYLNPTLLYGLFRHHARGNGFNIKKQACKQV